MLGYRAVTVNYIFIQTCSDLGNMADSGHKVQNDICIDNSRDKSSADRTSVDMTVAEVVEYA